MFSLFDYPVLATGTISGLAYVVIHYFAKDMLAGLRWLWAGLGGYVIIIALAALMYLAFWSISGHSWSRTAYQWIAGIMSVGFLFTFIFINGANRK